MYRWIPAVAVLLLCVFPTSSLSPTQQPSIEFRSMRLAGLGAGGLLLTAAGAFCSEPFLSTLPICAAGAILAVRSLPVEAKTPPLSLDNSLEVRPTLSKGSG